MLLGAKLAQKAHIWFNGVGNLLVRVYFTAFSYHSAAAPGTAFLLALISKASIMSYEKSSSILAQPLIPLNEKLTKMTFHETWRF